MGFLTNFPYTNFHELNLDWILKVLKELDEKVDKAIAGKITVADPIQWDITKQYEAYTIVMNDDKAYLSMQAVPYGIPIDNADYWQQLFDVSEVFATLKEAISFSDDGESATSSQARTVNSLVWLQEELYEVIAPIAMGDTYSAANVEKVSIETWIHALLNDLKETLEDEIDDLETDLSGDLSDAVTTLNGKIANAINLYKRNRKSVILIGDSYGLDSEYWRGWINAFSTLYGSNVTVKGKAVGGSAFNPGDLGIQNYNQSLVDVLATMTDAEKENVTDVIALGGYNDTSYGTTEAQFETYFAQFKTTALTACPNAKVSVGCAAIHYGNNSKMTGIKIANSYMEEAAEKTGIAYINDMILVLLNKALIFTTSGNPNANFHPNTDGNNAIAKHLYNYIMTDYIGDITYSEVLFGDNYNVYVHNGQVTAFPSTPGYFSASGKTFSGWIDVLSLENSNLLWCFNTIQAVAPSCPVSLVHSGSDLTKAPLILHARLYNNKLQVGNMYYTATVTGGSADFLTYPTFNCPWQAIY